MIQTLQRVANLRLGPHIGSNTLELLKWLALLSMLIDHLDFYCFQRNYRWMYAVVSKLCVERCPNLR